MEQKLADLLERCISSKALSAGKLLHSYILRTNFLLSNTFLSNRLIELYSKCNKPMLAHLLFNQIPHKNIHSYNTILSCLCKGQSLEDAIRLFDEMPERNSVSWNNVISGLVKCGGKEREALEVYGRMFKESVEVTRFTLASVLSACGVLGEVTRGSHGMAVKTGLDRNKYVANGLLCMYAKGRCMEDAIKVFEEMEEPNEVSFTTLMGGLAKSGEVNDALSAFRLMCANGIQIDSVTLSSVLGVCAKEGYETDESEGTLGKCVHGLVLKLGCEHDLHLSNSLLDMYTKHGNMESAEIIFSNLQIPSVVSWNVMIAGYGKRYQSEKALKFLERMQICGFDPDEVTYINMLAACIRSEDIETGRKIFDGMPFPSLTSWNSILSGYSQCGNHKEAIKLFREMQFRGDKPDRTTLSVILSSCAEVGLFESGRQIHAVSIRAAFYNDVYVGSALIDMYSKSGMTELGKHVFDRMDEVDIVCWNSMMACFLLSSKNKEAFTSFVQIRQKGMVPSHFSYATVLSCCSKLSSPFQGMQVHAQITKDGCVNDIFVGTSLVDMYCKCGDVDGARSFFNVMPSKNIVSWNEMLHGYAQNGRGDEAVCLYKDMLEGGEKPDAITFVAVLTACSHAGLVDTGIQLFNSMQQQHEIEPLLDHCTCIIDSLGRAGRFNEAEALIDEFPYKEDPVIWEVLLSSSRVHGNVRLAKKAAGELIRLDPQNSAAYSLLANSYSSSGQWDEAHTVREQMSDEHVDKDPGYSWIEYNHRRGKCAGEFHGMDDRTASSNG